MKIDLQQLYVNNLWQYHHLKLQELFKKTQEFIFLQHSKSTHLSMDVTKEIDADFQLCVTEMRHHYLELLHIQYPGYSLSVPYTPINIQKNLFYRHQSIYDKTLEHQYSTEPLSQDCNEYNYSDFFQLGQTLNYSKQNWFEDDRLNIETCHGIIEYCSRFFCPR